MLYQFLISNQTLELNETFNIYVKILSIDHMAIKEKEKGRQHKKRTRQFYKKIREKHFGSRESCSQKYNYFWALNVPKSYHGEPSLNFFENKCLLICATLGLLQQEFLKNNNNKTYIQIQKTINSSNKYKQTKLEIS